MAERRSDEARVPDETGDTIVVRRRTHPWRRLAIIVACTILGLTLIGVIAVWIERRPIASHFLQQEFQQRGVQSSYHLDKIGLRTQQVSNLVIGDPKRPDLTAKYAQVQMRVKWNGNFEVYRIVARGVRLRGRLVHGKVSWGQIDKLMPPPSNKPFALPNFVIDVADTTISLATPFGPLGVAIDGNGRLSGGFKGRVALSSPRLAPGHCEALQLRANLAVSVVARHPHVEGPVGLARFTCPASKFDILSPSFNAKAAFNEAFTSIDGGGRMAIDKLTAGANGLSAFVGDLTFKGSLSDVRGTVKLAAQNSRMATVFANRTALEGSYELGGKAGTFQLAGKVLADSARLDPSMLAGVTGPLAAAAKTPIGPIATAIGEAIQRTANNFNTSGDLRVVNFPGGGAARIQNASITGPQGAQARIFGGSGVTYYWPVGGLRIDSNIQMAGGGLPSARVTLRQARPGAPMNGFADIAPYSAGGARLAMAPIRFADAGGGRTAAQHRGPARRAVPERPGASASRTDRGPDRPRRQLRVRHGMRGGELQFAPDRPAEARPDAAARLPDGPSDHFQEPGPARCWWRRGSIRRCSTAASAARRFTSLRRSGQFTSKQFSFDKLGMRLGRTTSPIVFNTARLSGSFLSNGVGGVFSGGSGTVGSVPLAMSDASGKWSFLKSDLTVDGSVLVSDRNPDPRFYPLRSNDLHFTLAGDYVRATGTLRQPDTGIEVTDVSLEHKLSTGAGHATLDVPGICVRAELSARPADSADRRRGRPGQRHRARAGPDRLGVRREGHLDRRLFHRQHGPRGAVRPGRGADHEPSLHRSAEPRDGAAPGRDGGLGQPGHHGRERGHPVPDSAQ